MSPIEHYFENLLDMGSDIKGEPNKNALSKEVQEAIEICADYIKHNQFQGQYLTENCIACKYDETEEEDGEHCKKCLAGNSQFELDKEFVEPTTDVAIKALEQESVLDKIRAEIENHCGLTKENHCRYCSYCNSVMGVREILEILDKYKAESEEV